MSRRDKLLVRILRGGSDASIGFDELCGLLRALGFAERTHGSHHIFICSGIEELINLQRYGSHAKRYQVRQVRAILHKYRIGDDDME